MINRILQSKANRILLVVAAVLTLAGMAFKFVYIGHGILALTLWLIAAAIVWFIVLLTVPEGPCYKAADWLIKITIYAMVLFFILFSATEYMIIDAAKTDDDPAADYLIVLGAGVYGTRPSRSLTDRLTETLDYLEKYPDCVAVLSGGQGEHEDITEAECMYRWLTERGIAPERLIKEDAATSTQENLQFSFDIISEREEDDTTVAVLTSEYHLLRANLMAEKLGWNVKSVAAPTTRITIKINHFIREFLGIWHFMVLGY